MSAQGGRGGLTAVGAARDGRERLLSSWGVLFTFFSPLAASCFCGSLPPAPLRQVSFPNSWTLGWERGSEEQ